MLGVCSPPPFHLLNLCHLRLLRMLKLHLHFHDQAAIILLKVPFQVPGIDRLVRSRRHPSSLMHLQRLHRSICHPMHPHPTFYHNRLHHRTMSAFVQHRLLFNPSQRTCCAHINSTRQRRRLINHKPAMFSGFSSRMVPLSKEVGSLM